jgi:hypothetical protein
MLSSRCVVPYQTSALAAAVLRLTGWYRRFRQSKKAGNDFYTNTKVKTADSTRESM